MDSQPSTPIPSTVIANEQAITGASPAHYLDNDSRRGFCIATQRAERYLEFSFRDEWPDKSRTAGRAMLVAACYRKNPRDLRRLRLLAEFWMN